MRDIEAFGERLFADLNDGFGVGGVAAGAAVCEEKFEKSLQAFGVGGIAKGSGFAANVDEIFGFEFVEMI